MGASLNSSSAAAKEMDMVLKSEIASHSAYSEKPSYHGVPLPGKKKVYDLSRVINIRAVKKGHDGVNFYTLHYVIQAEFRDEPPIKILESSKRDKII